VNPTGAQFDTASSFVISHDSLLVASQHLHKDRYNSAVFGSISSYSYFAFTVSESFIASSECHNCTSRLSPLMAQESGMLRYMNDYEEVLTKLQQEAHDGRLDRIEAADCLNQYAKTIQSDRQNLQLVASDSSFPRPEENTYINGSMVYWAGSFTASDMAATLEDASTSYSWIRSALPDSAGACTDAVEQIKSAPETWRIGDPQWPVQYCLSQRAQPHCKLQFIPLVLIIVTALNFGKSSIYRTRCCPDQTGIQVNIATISQGRINTLYCPFRPRYSAHNDRRRSCLVSRKGRSDHKEHVSFVAQGYS
jgi:hypothetical protein